MSAPISAMITSAMRVNRVQPCYLLSQKGDDHLDLGAQRFAYLFQVVEMGQELSHQKRVVSAESAGQSLAQGRQLLAQGATGQVRQHRIRGPRDQSAHHRSTRHAEYVDRYRGQLDACVLQDLVKTIRLVGPLLDERLPITRDR